MGARLETATLLPSFPPLQSRRKLARGRLCLSASSAVFRWRRPSPLRGGRSTSWAHVGQTLPPPHPTPPLYGAQGERGREGAAWGPSHWQGWAWAWAPGNVLAQNYIRLEVSIFCSILLPDLIVHLWQCLYTSLLRTTRLPQQRVRANAEI